MNPTLVAVALVFGLAQWVGRAAPPDTLKSGASATGWPEQRIPWYDAPARAWSEALPVGNGRPGAMVFGSYPNERIQLNEDSIWAVDPLVRHPAGTKAIRSGGSDRHDVKWKST